MANVTEGLRKECKKEGKDSGVLPSLWISTAPGSHGLVSPNESHVVITCLLGLDLLEK